MKSVPNLITIQASRLAEGELGGVGVVTLVETVRDAPDRSRPGASRLLGGGLIFWPIFQCAEHLIRPM